VRSDPWQAGPARLSLADGEEISLGLRAGESFTAIAARLGKAASTVSREVAADGGRRDYRARRAHQRARAAPEYRRYHDAVIDLQVRDESGRILDHGERGTGLNWTQEFVDLDSSAYPMLAGICAYLDTIFNQRQLPLLLNELDRLPVDAVIPEESRVEIRRLAAVAQARSHLYLWFCGD
jgi:hypothetical protein